jgi:subtilisin family serine protease
MPGTTGRDRVLFDREAGAAGPKAFGQATGLSIASATDFAGGVAPEDLGGAGAILFPELAVAVVDAPPEQLRGVQAQAGAGVLAIEPERIVYALADLGRPPVPAGLALPFGAADAAGAGFLDYMRGYRDAVTHLYDQLTGESAEGPAAEAALPRFSETEATWGLQATRVTASSRTGRGIRVAVLDTGFDLTHPDFAGRMVTSASFIDGQAVQDGHGHGTHCIGTACGPARPGLLPRYGVACEAEIFAGKVLSDQGSGFDAGILNGLNWALANGCAIVSMSLGSGVQPGQGFSQVFERVARRALRAGTVIIAAAGNDSRRPGSVAAVGHPANCPSILAVGALDRRGQVASFSNGGLNPQGGQVDIAGPGVDVRSSWPQPALHNTISGTSMATPHVAGIAALWAEVDANFRGRELMSILAQNAQRLALPARDVGVGLVQAP